MKKGLSETLQIIKCPDCGVRVAVLGGAFVQHGKQADNGKFIACPGSGKYPPRTEKTMK